MRPDVWAHLLFGRGYGSYDHVSYRILDSEILSRIVDTGVLGFLTLLLMLASIVLTARILIRERHPVWSPPALMVACAAVAFFVLTFLFDVSSFPHTPYILMSLAGLLAAIVQHPADKSTGARPGNPHEGQRRSPPTRRDAHPGRPLERAVHH